MKENKHIYHNKRIFTNMLGQEENASRAAERIFRLYPSVNDIRLADPQVLYSILLRCRIEHPEKKTQHVIRAARKIVLEYNGVAPYDETELLQFPGVNRDIIAQIFLTPVLKSIKQKKQLKISQQELLKIEDEIV